MAHSSRPIYASVVLFTLAVIPCVHAQEISAEANYGLIELDGGFLPDPVIRDVSAGGNTDASNISGCSGYISNAPDLELNYSNPALELSFFVESASDATLLINGPAGNWYCNDDFSTTSDTNPGIVFEDPAPGIYDIWVGTYSSEDIYNKARVIITELDVPWDDYTGSNSVPDNGVGFDPSLEAFNSESLPGNFSPDPYIINVVAGGLNYVGYITGCTGYVSSAPDLELSFINPSNYSLSFFVDGDIDTTLVINGPDGQWYCNDDFETAGGFNPGVVFDSPQSGVYDVWIGKYSEDAEAAIVQLIVTELEQPPLFQSGGERLVRSGTGFLVSRAGHVLTNHHVIEGCSRMTFQIRGQLETEALLLASNRGTDLGLLKTDITIEPSVFRGPQNVRLGDEVVVYGFPLFGDLSSQGNLTTGIVSALSGLNDDLSRLQMTAQIQSGSSGGPVMNRSGEIVGVVVETANAQFFEEERGTSVQNINFAIRDSLARSFLDTNNVEYTVGVVGADTLSVADIAEAAQRTTGIILCYQ